MTSIKVKIIDVRQQWKDGYTDEQILEDCLNNLNSVCKRIISVVPQGFGKYFLVFEV